MITLWMRVCQYTSIDIMILALVTKIITFFFDDIRLKNNVSGLVRRNSHFFIRPSPSFLLFLSIVPALLFFAIRFVDQSIARRIDLLLLLLLLHTAARNSDNLPPCLPLSQPVNQPSNRLAV